MNQKIPAETTAIRPPGPEALANAVTKLRRHLVRFLYRCSERVYEWRFGIATRTEVQLRDFGINDPAAFAHVATSYRRFFQLMKLLPIRPGEDVFLDFGAGMGRAVVLAATYPFRKVIGVELVPELANIARENVRRIRPRLTCPEVEIHNTDARNFEIPPEVSVIYFWNPFGEEILASVFENIIRSFRKAPRDLTIVHLSPKLPSCLDNIKDRFGWLKERQRTSLGSTSVAIYSCEVAGESPVENINAVQTRRL